MTIVRLVADDLTGALDSSAPFAAVHGSIEVRFERPESAAGLGSLAIDAHSRQLSGAKTYERSKELARVFKGSDIAYKKLDSTLRGHPAAEIAGAWLSQQFRSAVIAPAFPDQGRITRQGRQYLIRADGSQEQVGADLLGELRRNDLPVTHVETIPPDGPGLHVFDATCADDLDAIVAAASALPRPLLWVGSAGLARAVARNPKPSIVEAWDRPWLGFIGSAHPVALEQARRLEAIRPGSLVEIDPTEDSASGRMGKVASALERGEGRIVRLDTTGDLSRSDAGKLIDAFVGLLINRLPRPGTLIAIGGETFSRFCAAQETQSLLVTGEFAPGTPVAEIVHGAWSGVRVIAKSGGFGSPDALCDIVQAIEA